MGFQLKDKNDIKIFILYLLRNIDYPLDFVNINDIVVQDGVVGHFDFIECFSELLETGNVAEIKKDGEDYYVITNQGKHVADNLDSRLINMLKEKSLKSALRLLSFKKKNAKIKVEYEPMSGNRILARCIISERDENILDVKLILESVNQLERIKRNFYDNPEVVYKGILAVLTGEVNYLID